MTQDLSPNINHKYRWLENGHIFLWLIKDTCWALEFKYGAIFMIIPTMLVAIFILWKLRKSTAELYHNLAVCLWIAANSFWMVGEFVDKDTRPVAATLFAFGLALLLFYYTKFLLSKHRASSSK